MSRRSDASSSLDAVCDVREAIEAAASLARRWHAELHGLFVRDSGLLGLAELPFVREVTLAAAPLAIAPEALLAELAAAIDRAEKTIGETARSRSARPLRPNRRSPFPA